MIISVPPRFPFKVTSQERFNMLLFAIHVAVTTVPFEPLVGENFNQESLPLQLEILQLVLPERLTVKVSEPAFEVSYIASRDNLTSLGASPCVISSIYCFVPASVMTISPVLEVVPVYTSAEITKSLTPLVPEVMLRDTQEGLEVTVQFFLEVIRTVSVSFSVSVVVFV